MNRYQIYFLSSIVFTAISIYFALNYKYPEFLLLSTVTFAIIEILFISIIITYIIMETIVVLAEFNAILQSIREDEKKITVLMFIISLAYMLFLISYHILYQ